MKRKLGIVLLSLAALALGTTYAPLHPWDDDAIVIQRDAEGSWFRQGAADRALRARWAKSEMETGCMRSTEPTPRGVVPTRVERIWILNLSESALTRGIGEALQRALLERPELREVAYLPAHDLPLAVHRPPDVFVTVRELERRERHAPGLFALDAQIELTAARRPLESESEGELGAERRGPTLGARFWVRERAVGLITRAARHAPTIEHAVRSFALGAELDLWLASSGAHVPEAWLGRSPPAPTDLPLVGEPGARLLLSQAPPPMLVEQTWILDAAPNPFARIEAARDALTGLGWNLAHEVREPGGRAYSFRVLSGARSVGMYVPRDLVERARLGEPGEIVVQHQQGPTPAELRAWVAERASEPETRAALTDLLRSLQPATRAELRAVLEAEPVAGFDVSALALASER